MLRELALDEVYPIIGAGPVLLVATRDGAADNVMAMGWHTMLEFKPPTVGCCIAKDHLTGRTLRKSRVCVLAVPGWDLLEQTIGAGSVSGLGGADKFARFGLTRRPAAEVDAPLVEECLYNFECRLTDTTLAERFDLLVVEVVRAWVNPQRQERRFFHGCGGDTFAPVGEIRDCSELAARLRAQG